MIEHSTARHALPFVLAIAGLMACGTSSSPPPVGSGGQSRGAPEARVVPSVVEAPVGAPVEAQSEEQAAGRPCPSDRTAIVRS